MISRQLSPYPGNWELLARLCKEASQKRCTGCHIEQRAERKSRQTGKLSRVWLHAAHIFCYDTSNPYPQLRCLCPTCHGWFDYWYRLRRDAVTLERLKHRRMKAAHPHIKGSALGWRSCFLGSRNQTRRKGAQR